MGGRSVHAALLVVALLLMAASVHAGGPKAFPVTVVNPPAHPVPVTIQGGGITGNVTVTNTPNANVTNEVAARIVNMPGLAPYRSDRHLTLPDGTTSIQGP